MKYSYDVYQCAEAAEDAVATILDSVDQDEALDAGEVLWGVMEHCAALMLDGLFTREELVAMIQNARPVSETIFMKG